jgi:hypothetical protein
MTYKTFSKDLHKKNDNLAKNASVEFLLGTKNYEMVVPLCEQKEMYKAWDFAIRNIKTQRDVYVESEIKSVWTKRGVWQGWDTIDVPYRKAESKADLYVMLNKFCDTLAIASMKTIIKSPVDYKNTIYTKNEPFFKVALDSFRFYTKDTNGWIRCK